jgi:hypothetical protein
MHSLKIHDFAMIPSNCQLEQDCCKSKKLLNSVVYFQINYNYDNVTNTLLKRMAKMNHLCQEIVLPAELLVLNLKGKHS